MAAGNAARLLRLKWPGALRSRLNLVIGIGRAIFAGFFLFAIWLDPSQPAYHEEETYAILIGYLVYSVAILLATWHREEPIGTIGLVTHCVDLCVYTVLMYLTQGPTSPFFVLFTFSLLCGTLQWAWRGTLYTAVGVLTLFLLFVLVGSSELTPWYTPDFEFDRAIIRTTYLAVTAALLAYVGWHQEHMRLEIAMLASGPPTLSFEGHPPIAQALEHARLVFDADRTLLAWSDQEETWLQIAWLSGSQFRQVKEAPATFEPLIEPDLDGHDFVTFGQARSRVLVRQPSRDVGGLRWRSGPALNRDFCARFGIDGAIVVSLAGQSFDGHLFILDKPSPSADDLLIARIVADQIVGFIDLLHFLRLIRARAATEERVRMARDLHDGVLQALAGTVLQLQDLARIVERDPGEARRRMSEIQHALAAEQRDLRALIQQSRPRSPVPQPFVGSLAVYFDQLAARLSRQWSIEVSCRTEPDRIELPIEFMSEIGMIVSEGAANAKRHGDASRLVVEAGLADRAIELTIVDDGKGFVLAEAPGTGEAAGPATLRERVGALGGTLTVHSSRDGVALRMRLPLPGTETEHDD